MEWAISGTAEAPSTTVRQAPRTGEDTVYSPKKYRETEGMKDYNSITHSQLRNATQSEINGQIDINNKLCILPGNAGYKASKFVEASDGNITVVSGTAEEVYKEGDFVSNWYLDNIYNAESGYIAYIFKSGSIPSNAIRVGTVRYGRVHKTSTTKVTAVSGTKKYKYTASSFSPAYSTYVPSRASQEKKTVLAQSGSTAMQNFAFEGMEDVE